MSKNKWLNHLTLIISIFMLFSLTAGTSISQGTISNEIPRSKIDKTQQAVLQLDNGMKVLIIQDPEATQSMVSIHVAAGGYKDPDTQIGLAHFLEHSIFMGSKKHPQPTEIFNYISEHSGEVNATTTNTGTTFFFRTEINSLGGALDRMVDAIAHPNLEDRASLSELKNVQSEFQASQHSFYRQYNDSMSESIYNPDHPISRQPTGGNLDSLKNKPNSNLMEELRKFHREYYSANIMNAVVYSKLPTDYLIKVATEYFSQIPNHKIKLTEIKEKRTIDKQRILYLQSEDKGRMIVLTFQLPKFKYNFAALSYIGFLLQNMQSGTAYDILFKNNLITSLSSSYEVTYLEPEDELSIYISLTDKGVKQQDLVVNTVFNYLELIKRKGIQESYFQQLKKTLDNNFNHLKYDYSMSSIALLSSLMQELPANQLYNYSLIPNKMQPKDVLDTLNHITLENTNIAYASTQEKYNKVSKYYKAKYRVETYNSDRFSNQTITKNFSRQLKLPPLNDYITDDFSINNSKAQIRNHPKLLENPYNTLIYSMPSQHFTDNPNVYLSIQITNPIHFKQEKDYAIPALMYIIFFKHFLGYFSKYDYSNIDWSYSFSNGQSIFLRGVPQHMLSMTKDFLSKFKTFHFDSTEELQAAKTQFKQDLIEKKANMGALDSAFEVFNTFSYGFIDDAKLIPAVDKINVKDLNKYHQTLQENNKTKIFSFGNLNDKQVLEFTDSIEKIYPSQNASYPPIYFPDIKSQKMVFTQKSQQENNAIVIAYYLPQKSVLENNIYARFLSLLLNDSFFYRMRTQKQLGYTVGVSEINFADGKVLAFFVESPNTTPKELYENIQQYYNEALLSLKSIPEEKFNNLKYIINTNLTGIPQDMNDEFKEHNIDFTLNNTKQPIFQQMADISNAISKKDVIDYFENAVINEKGLVLLSEIIANNQNSDTYIVPKGYKLYDSLDKLHKDIHFSPIKIR